MPFLVGCFEKKQGTGSAFTLVNMQDLQTPADANIKFKQQGTVILCYDGEPQVMTIESCWYEVKLEAGDGVFVTVE